MMKLSTFALLISSIGSFVASKTLVVSHVSISVQDTVHSTDVYGYIAEDSKEFSFTISRPRQRFSKTPTALYKGDASVTSDGERTLGKMMYRLLIPYPELRYYPTGGATLTEQLGIAIVYKEDDREPGMQGDIWRTSIIIPPESIMLDYSYDSSVTRFNVRQELLPLRFEMNRVSQ